MNPIISAATYLPGIRVAQRAIRLLAKYGHEGPVRTQYGYWIQYGPAPPEAAGLRRAAISGSYETADFLALRRFATGVVIDVGAHEGFVSLYLAQSASRVIACEPNAENLDRLRKNVRLNPGLRVDVEACAVGAYDGEVDFHFAEGCGAWGAIARVPSRHPRTVRVPLQTLNSIVSRACVEPERVSLIKIDTEGHELDVLRGADQVLRAHRPVVCFEVSLTHWASAQESVDVLLEFVTSRGYRLFQADDAGDLVPIKWLNRRIDNIFACPE